MQTTKTLIDGTTAPTMPEAPTCPRDAVEMQVTLQTLIGRKAANGESFQFVRNGRNALDLLRRELKRRLNKEQSERLPDELNEEAEKAVAMFQSRLLASITDDGYELTNVRKAVTYVRRDADGEIKDDGFRNVAVARRDSRNDGERLKIYQDDRRKASDMIARIERNPEKYAGTNALARAQKAYAQADAICKMIAPPPAKVVS